MTPPNPSPREGIARTIIKALRGDFPRSTAGTSEILREEWIKKFNAPPPLTRVSNKNMFNHQPNNKEEKALQTKEARAFLKLAARYWNSDNYEDLIELMILEYPDL